MMMKYTRYLILLPLFYIILSPSCANTSTPPSGGPKDTIAPIIVKMSPDSNAVHFPVKGGRISIEFNEFVTLKEESKNIFISPPLPKKLETKIRARGIIVTIPSTLDSGKTYTINFGNAIVDNNEGNQFPSYSFPFSTGDYVDSLLLSGRVYDYKTLLPLDNIIVALYENHADSAVYKLRPAKIAKTNKWGYFVVKNLKPVEYRVYAFGDINENYIFDPENEKIAFLDTLVKPGIVMKKGVPQLTYVPEKDTSASLALPAEINLYLFKEPTVKQYVKNNGRPETKKFFIKFASPKPVIDSIFIEDYKPLPFIKQYNSTKDSLVLWVRDTSAILKDTVNMVVNYMKSDTSDNLVKGSDTLKMTAPRQKKDDEKQQRRSNFGQKEEKVRKDLLDLKIDALPDMVEQYGYQLIFPSPLYSMRDSLVKLESISPKGIKNREGYSFERDVADSCIYRLHMKGAMKQGFEYILTIKKGAFMDIYKYSNDSISKSVILPNDEKLSKIVLEISGVKSHYIVELTNLSREKVYRSLKCESDTTLTFPYVAPGEYSIRITEDINNNGIIDSGSLADKRAPEKVRLYTLPGGATSIKIPESAEINQRIDLKTLFK